MGDTPFRFLDPANEPRLPRTLAEQVLYSAEIFFWNQATEANLALLQAVEGASSDAAALNALDQHTAARLGTSVERLKQRFNKAFSLWVNRGLVEPSMQVVAFLEISTYFHLLQGSQNFVKELSHPEIASIMIKGAQVMIARSVAHQEENLLDVHQSLFLDDSLPSFVDYLDEVDEESENSPKAFFSRLQKDAAGVFQRSVEDLDKRLSSRGLISPAEKLVTYSRIHRDQALVEGGQMKKVPNPLQYSPGRVQEMKIQALEVEARTIPADLDRMTRDVSELVSGGRRLRIPTLEGNVGYSYRDMILIHWSAIGSPDPEIQATFGRVINMLAKHTDSPAAMADFLQGEVIKGRSNKIDEKSRKRVGNALETVMDQLFNSITNKLDLSDGSKDIVSITSYLFALILSDQDLETTILGHAQEISNMSLLIHHARHGRADHDYPIAPHLGVLMTATSGRERLSQFLEDFRSDKKVWDEMTQHIAQEIGMETKELKIQLRRLGPSWAERLVGCVALLDEISFRVNDSTTVDPENVLNSLGDLEVLKKKAVLLHRYAGAMGENNPTPPRDPSGGKKVIRLADSPSNPASNGGSDGVGAKVIKLRFGSGTVGILRMIPQNDSKQAPNMANPIRRVQGSNFRPPHLSARGGLRSAIQRMRIIP